MIGLHMTLVPKGQKLSNDFVWAVVRKTGLRFSTVRNLLVNGWSYEERLGETSRWVAPGAQLQRRKGDK